MWWVNVYESRGETTPGNHWESRMWAANVPSIDGYRLMCRVKVTMKGATR